MASESEILMAASTAQYGIVLGTDDRNLARQRLYAAMRQVGLKFELREGASPNELLVLKPGLVPKGKPANHADILDEIP